MENEILKFIWKFFKNMDATLSIRNDIVTISNVPEKFEKFYGKKSPYKFTVEKSLESEEVEYLEKNSYSLKVISDYLESSGQTTLLKLKFNHSTEDEIRKGLNLGNALIQNISPKKRTSVFFRFTFHTAFQYLNEREKLINEIYVHEGKIVNGNLNDYKVEEGKKLEVRTIDMKEPYFIAKEELKKRIANKTQDAAIKLNSILEKEIKRVEEHFQVQEKELLSELKKANVRLQELEKEGDNNKIQRQKNVVKNIKEKLNPEELLNDKERSILLEKTKHSLNVNNKLFNTTLIYHELYSADVTIKNDSTKKTFETTFNPLKKAIEKIKCSICKEPMNKIYLCKSNHLACRNCMALCKSCGKEYCKNCLKINCELCGVELCNDCKVRCAGCGKLMCKSHTTQDNLSRRHYCNKCLTRCERCATLNIGTDFRKSPKTGVKVCGGCYQKEIKDSIVRNLF